MADIVAKPLSIILEKSWRSRDIPDAWKRANVILIYKKGSKEALGNYRPLVLIQSLGTGPPKNYYKPNEAGDWERPAQICQRQIIPDKPDHFLQQNNIFC